jgi:hypothetical protein
VCQEDRNVGDYGIGPGITNEAQELIVRAEELIRVVAEKLKSGSGMFKLPN